MCYSQNSQVLLFSPPGKSHPKKREKGRTKKRKQMGCIVDMVFGQLHYKTCSSLSTIFLLLFFFCWGLVMMQCNCIMASLRRKQSMIFVHMSKQSMIKIFHIFIFSCGVFEALIFSCCKVTITFHPQWSFIMCRNVDLIWLEGSHTQPTYWIVSGQLQWAWINNLKGFPPKGK